MSRATGARMRLRDLPFARTCVPASRTASAARFRRRGIAVLSGKCQTRLHPAGPCPLNRTSQARRLLRLSRKSFGNSDVLEDMWTIGARVVWNAGRSRSELVVPPSVQHRGAANEVPPTKSPIGAGFPRATRRGAWMGTVFVGTRMIARRDEGHGGPATRADALSAARVGATGKFGSIVPARNPVAQCCPTG